jgi:hypothetical protein
MVNPLLRPVKVVDQVVALIYVYKGGVMLKYPIQIFDVALASQIRLSAMKVQDLDCRSEVGSSFREVRCPICEGSAVPVTPLASNFWCTQMSPSHDTCQALAFSGPAWNILDINAFLGF